MYNEIYEGFTWFGLAHLGALLLMILLLSLIIVFRDKITIKLDLILRRSVAIFMVFLEFNYYIWVFFILKSPFEPNILPLGLCALSMYLTAYTLWTKNERLFRIIFPWALSGAVLSLIVADLNYTFPHFRYIHYFGNHIFFMIGNLYLLIALKFRFIYKDLLKSSLYLLIYATIIYPINFLLDSNHLFLRELPSGTEAMFGFLGSFWVLGFAFSIFLLFHVVYLPALIMNRTKRL
jgi:hypothetical integral membrane protein (TIGR02206 family)